MPAPKLKPEIIHIRTGLPRHATWWLSLSPRHHLVRMPRQILELVDGEVRRTADGYASSARSLPDGRVVVLGHQDVGVWEGDTLVMRWLTLDGPVLESIRDLSTDGRNVVAVGRVDGQNMALRAGLDGVVIDRHGAVDACTFVTRGATVYLVERTAGSIAATVWDENGARLLGTVPSTLARDPFVNAYGDHVLVSHDAQVHHFDGSGVRTLAATVISPAMDEEGFVDVDMARGALCRWRYDGTVAWERPTGRALRTLHDGNVVMAHSRERQVLVNVRTGELIGDVALKLTRTESIDGLVATRDGAIVLCRRQGEHPKHAFYIGKGEAPVMLKHEGVGGAMPYGDRMATGAGSADEDGVVTLHVWDIAAP